MDVSVNLQIKTKDRVFFYNSHRVKSSFLSLELSFRLLSDDSILCDNSKQRVSIFKKPSTIFIRHSQKVPMGRV